MKSSITSLTIGTQNPSFNVLELRFEGLLFNRFTRLLLSLETAVQSCDIKPGLTYRHKNMLDVDAYCLLVLEAPNSYYIAWVLRSNGRWLSTDDITISSLDGWMVVSKL